MGYRIVEDYHRQQHFDFFSGYSNPHYAVTFELDITTLKSWTDRKGYSIYLNLCYFFVRAMQPIEDFRYRIMDGGIALYDLLEVAATLPSPDGLFSFGYFGYSPDSEDFNRRAEAVNRKIRGLTTLEQPADTNQVLFTALPEIRFTGMTHATPEARDCRPRVAFGKFFDVDGGLSVPVSLQVNHVFIDGQALGALVEGAQREFDQPS